MPGLKTFVVESDRPDAGGLAAMLGELGHDVCGIAQDVSQLASLLARLTPDLIALDLDLEQGNEGLGLATVLQATGPIAIVFVAETVDRPEREGIRAVEGTALLTRPFGAAELRTAVALAFERARAARDGRPDDGLAGPQAPDPH